MAQVVETHEAVLYYKMMQTKCMQFDNIKQHDSFSKHALEVKYHS